MSATARFTLPEKLRVHHFTSNPAWPNTPGDKHEFHELIVLLRGDYRVRIGEALHKLKVGDGMFYPAGTVHQPIYSRQFAVELLCVNWHAPDLGIPVAMKLPDTAGRLAFLIQWLHEAVSDNAPPATIILRVHALFDYVTGQTRSRPTTRAGYALRHTVGHLKVGHGVAEMAKVAGISRSQLYRDLRREQGLTPSAALRAARLEKARALLANTNLTVKEIAEQVGYRNPNHLTNLIHAHHGQSPTALRREFRRNSPQPLGARA